MEEGITLNDVAKVIVIVFIAGLVIGGIVLAWMNILGPAFNQLDYNLFNNSAQHIQAVANQIQTDCTQLPTYKTGSAAYKAVEQDIDHNLGQVSSVKVLNLSPATQACVNQAEQDVQHP